MGLEDAKSYNIIIRLSLFCLRNVSNSVHHWGDKVKKPFSVDSLSHFERIPEGSMISGVQGVFFHLMERQGCNRDNAFKWEGVS